MTRKTPYTTAATIERDATDWMAVLGPDLRHPGPGSLDRAALVVLDLQRYFLDPSSPAFLPAAAAAVPAVRALVEAFRTAGRLVVFTRHVDPEGEGGRAMEAWWGRRLREGDPLAALSFEAGVRPEDLVLTKATYSAFEGTGLADLLRERGADTVVLCGVQTHLCVETSARHAFTLGFWPVVVVNATAAPDLDLHLGALRGLGHGLARVVLSGEVIALLEPRTPVRGGCAPLGRASVLVPPSCPRGEVFWDPAAPSASTDLDLLVIGAGPAGLAAATQGQRMGLRTLVVERDRPGGLVRAALLVENYPGFPGGIRGEDLASRMEAQARALGVAVARGDIAALFLDEGSWVARGSDCTPCRSRAVVLATGTSARRLGVPGEADLAGRGVFFRVDEIPGDLAPGSALVVGGGDCALDQALHLWQRGWRVEVLMRGPRPRALSLLLERAAARGIPVRPDTVAVTLRDRGGRVVVLVRGPCGEAEREVDLVLVSSGREPVLPALPGQLDLAMVDAQGRAPWPGLYVAGDCRRGLVRQIAVAVGDGVAAAMDAARYLESRLWR